MVKIFLGKMLKQGKGVCDFCGEKTDDGVVGDKIEKELYFTNLKDNFELEWFRRGFWSVEKLYWATPKKEYETRKEIVNFIPLICKDCIRQLNKQF